MPINAYTDVAGLVMHFDARRDLWNETAKTNPCRDNSQVGAWLSQVAGAAADVRLLQQNTDGNKPLYRGGDRHGSCGPGVKFHNQGLNGATYGAGPNKLRIENTYAGTAFTNQNLTIVGVIAQGNPIEGAVSGGVAGFLTGQLVGLDGFGPIGLCTYQNKLYERYVNGTAGDGVQTTPTDYIGAGLVIPHNPTVVAVRVATGGGLTVHTFREGESASAVDSRATITLRTAGGGYFSIGCTGSTTALPWIGTVHELLAWPTAITDAQLQDVIDFAMTKWGIARAKKLNVLCLGDSNTSGKITSSAGDVVAWPEIFSGLIDGGMGHRMSNLGYTAISAFEVNNDTNFAALVTPSIQAAQALGQTTIAFVKYGTNDIYLNNKTAAQTVTALTGVAGRLKAAGVTRVVGFTVEPAYTTVGGYNYANRTDLNALLLANYLSYGFDDMIDLDAEFVATKGFTTDPTLDTRNYIDETTARVHLRGPAEQVVAHAAHKKIKPWLSNIGGVTYFGGASRAPRGHLA